MNKFFSSIIYRKSAFSLLEILIALALFAIVIGGILALFPAAMRSNKEGDDEARSLLIASSVMETLCSDEDLGTLHIMTGMSNNLPLWEIITSNKATNLSIAYNSSCEPLRKLSANEADIPISDHSIASVVTLTLTAKNSSRGLISSEVSVASPASAPASARLLRRFVKLIAIPAS